MNVQTLIIDGKNAVMRGFFAYPVTLAAQGQSTNLIHGALLELFRLVKQFAPRRVIVTWDSPSAYRRLVYPAYKAKRKPMQSAMFTLMTQQLTMYQNALKALPVIQLTADGVEADDLIAFCTIIKPEYDDQVIVSTDRDFWQLVRGERVVIWEPKKKHLLTGTSFTKVTNFQSPRHHLAFRCLRGDGDEAPLALRGVSDEKAKERALDLRLPMPGMRNGDASLKWEHGDAMDPLLRAAIWRNYQLVCLHQGVVSQTAQLVALDFTPASARYNDFLAFCQKYRLNKVLEAYDDVRKLFDAMGG